MKTISCFAFATLLNLNYNATDPYESRSSFSTHTSLREYLKHHGVLFTICEPYGCSLKPGANHVAASWVNQELGMRYLPMNTVGYIFYPPPSEFRCFYPGDAATDKRDDAGCGPDALDPVHGSKGASRLNETELQQVRDTVNRHKQTHFSSDDWTDIGCHNFFRDFPTSENPHFTGATMWSNTKDDCTSIDMNQNTIDSYESILKADFDAIMGHQVCSIHKSNDEPSMLISIYRGPCSWTDWQAMIDTQLDFAATYKVNPPGGFNEIVMDIAYQEELKMAVFYLVKSGMTQEDVERAQARAQTEAGNQYIVIEWNVSQHSETFRCPNELTMPRTASS